MNNILQVMTNAKVNLSKSLPVTLLGLFLLAPTHVPPEVVVVPVDISRHFNNDGVAFLTNPNDGNLCGGALGFKYPGEMFPEDGKTHYKGVTFALRGLQDGGMNNIKAEGQRISLPEGSFTYLYLAGTAVEGDHEGVFTVVYVDGTEQALTVGLSDWCQAPIFGEAVIASSPHRLSHAGVVPPACNLFVQVLPLDPERVVRTLILPDRSQMRIFALTLVRGITLNIGAVDPSVPRALPAARVREGREHGITSFQTSLPYNPKISLETDIVVVHSHGAPAPRLQHNIHSWKEQGYEVHRMFFVGSDAGRIFVDGAWDGENHWDQVQTRSDGTPFKVNGRPYMTPSDNWARFLEERMIQPALDAGAVAIWPEEPLAFTRAGHEPYFREAWQRFFGEPWQDPQSSPNNFWRVSKLYAELYHRLIERLGNFTKTQAAAQGREVKYFIPTHSIISHTAGGMVFSPARAMALESVDGMFAQVWTGPVRWSLGNYAGLRSTSFFESAFSLYSYFRNLAKGTGKELHFVVDPKEDDPRHAWPDYERWFEETVLAMLFFPDVYRFEVMPWPERVFPVAPADYRTQLLNNFAAFHDLHRHTEVTWDTGTRGIGVLVSDTMGWQMGGPSGVTNMDAFHGLFLPLAKRGILPEVVPIERIGDPGYLDEFEVLLLSYDMWKPLHQEYHQHLSDWVKSGGVLLFVGGICAYNQVDAWWTEAGYSRPQDHLLGTLGIRPDSARELPASALGYHSLRPEIQGNLTTRLLELSDAPQPAVAGAFIPGTKEELRYLDEEVAPTSPLVTGGRFADAHGSWTYRFILPGVRSAQAELTIGNNFLVEISGDNKTWVEVMRSAHEERNLANLTTRVVDLTPHIGDNGTVLLRFRDASVHDGWGPYLRKLNLIIEGTAEQPIVASEAFVVSTRSPLMGYQAPDVRSLFSRAGYDVIWEKDIGEGALMYIGIPAEHFAGSIAGAQMLRELVRRAYEMSGITYEEQGYVKLQRGRYTVVRALSEEVVVQGRFLDMFDHDLSIVQDPVIEAGTGLLLYDIGHLSAVDKPGVIFSSKRLEDVQEIPQRTTFTIESPTGTYSVARLHTGRNNSATIAAYHQGNTWPIEAIFDPGSRTLLVRFSGRSEGIQIEIDWSEAAR